jgi:NADH-quinone oxidoreductase subunit N
MPPKHPADLAALASHVQPFMTQSLQHFLPETILTGGFLLAIILDLFITKGKDRRITGYFAILVFAAAGYASFLQWIPFDPLGHDWKGGTMIFNYFESLTPPLGMMVVDNFAVFFKLLISLTGIFIILMSLSSSEVGLRKSHFGEYYSLLIGMAIGMFLMPASTDLIMMYISLELVSITSYILAGFMKESNRSTEASMKYVLYGAFSSGLMLYGFSLLYGLTGTTNILAIKMVLQNIFANPATHPSTITLWIATILSLAGMGYKISAAPFHFWTPDVYEGAPIPITALLSVASKAAGFGLLLRFLLFVYPMNAQTGFPIINWPLLIAGLAALTMTLGNFAALQQSNIKRMLAYSTIAHAGYMMVGLVAAGAETGLTGMQVTQGSAGIVAIMIYLISYLFMNLGAFYVVMLIANKINSEEIEDYRGLARRTPLLCVALGLFLVSLTGIPLTIGFIGKLYIFSAILKVDPVTHHITYLWLAIVAILNSVVSLYYYIRVMAAMFIKERKASTLTDGNGALIITNDGALTYSFSNKMLLFAFLIPVIGLGVYFAPVVDFAGNVVRFFTLQ